ncbi:MAG: hypothetical protein EBU07_15765 [Betaproteobacteria bacterium]|nr:hypothetical protein [Betaproteobacteria bacterium]
MRDARIDTLRGLFLVVMTVDHVAPAWITRYTSETFGFVSAMEGFFLLSGYSFALAYQRLLATPRQLWAKIRARAMTLYAYHLATLGIAVAIGTLGLASAIGWDARAADAARFGPSLLVWTLLLFYRPQYFDVLPCYILLVLAAPLALRALGQTRRAGAMLALSAALWALGQMTDPFAALARALSPIQSVWPNFLSWQLLFVLGMACAMPASVDLVRPWLRRPLLAVLCLALALLCLSLRQGWLTVDHALLGGFEKANLGPLRVLNVLLLLYLGALLIGRFRRASSQPFLALLGAHSLEVFSFHILLAYAAQPWVDSLSATDDRLQVAGLVLACVMALALPAWLHRRYRNRRSA